ncbi:MAG: hypothetical protein ACRDNS_31285 [Trebonia sp.]
MIYSFAVTIEGIDLTSPDSPHADALFEAGCDDALLSSSGGVQRASFDRQAASFADAVAGAIAAIETSVPGARVRQVERLDNVGEALTRPA